MLRSTLCVLPCVLALSFVGSASAVAAPAGPTVKLALADGATISDVTEVLARVTADGDVGIDKVEFAVDDKLRVTDSSTPYSFPLDTLEEGEGAHTITATAFDAQGRTARARISVTVDNELAKGADAHASTAMEAVKAGDTPKAQRFARRALKIDPTNLGAARALAGIYRANGELASAVAVLSKASFPATEVEARRDLISLHIARAEESGSTEELLAEAQAAIEVHRKITEILAEKARGTGTGPEQALAVGDALFTGHRWTEALQAYQQAGNVDNAPIAALNRQLLTLARAGRLKDADSLLRQIKRAKKEDETTVLLEGMLQLYQHRLNDARNRVADAAQSKLAAQIVLTYANLAARKTDKGQNLLREAQQLAEEAAKNAPELAETHLALAFSHPDPVDARRAAFRALAIDPSLPEAYAFWAYNTLLGRDKKRFEAADLVLDYALKLEPNNNYVLMAKVVCLLLQKRPQEAEPLMAQLLKQDPDAPDVHVANALNLSLLDRTLTITDELNLALKLDPERWNDVFVLKPEELLARVYRYRYSPVLTPASVFLAQ